MTETINKETVAGEAGAEETPTPQPSETQAAPSAVDEASLKAIIEPLIQAEVEKRTQSVKDKRIAKQESRISGLEDTLAQYKELQAEGMSEKQIVQFMKVNEFLASQGQEALPVAPPTEEPAVQPTVAPDALLSSVLNLAGLDSNDADVVEIIRANPNSPAAQIIAVNQLVESRKKTTSPNVGAVLPSGGGQALETETIESVSAELHAELLKPASPETRERIRELGKKQKELLPKG
jgi:hypothetical protein